MTKKILLLVLLAFVSCKNYNSESEFMDCIYSKNGEAKLIIENIIFQHEVYLKSNELIDNNTGKDYKKFIEQIANGTINLNDIEKTLALDVENLNLDVIGCGEKFSSKSAKAKETRNLFNDILENKAGVKEAFSNFDKIVTEKDFEHPFYKICTFVILDYYILGLNK